MTAEGIRTALYFGVACGRELRAALDGRQPVSAALRRYHEFSASHRLPFECMYAAQQSVRRLHGTPMNALVRLFGRRAVAHWAFRHYLDIAPPSAALPAPPLSGAAAARAA
jgi:hypothetical protein